MLNQKNRGKRAKGTITLTYRKYDFKESIFLKYIVLIKKKIKKKKIKNHCTDSYDLPIYLSTRCHQDDVNKVNRFGHCTRRDKNH